MLANSFTTTQRTCINAKHLLTLLPTQSSHFDSPKTPLLFSIFRRVCRPSRRRICPPPFLPSSLTYVSSYKYRHPTVCFSSTPRDSQGLEMKKKKSSATAPAPAPAGRKHGRRPAVETATKLEQQQQLPPPRHFCGDETRKLERTATEDVNASAEAFIKKFRNQLLIQRLESIENYEKMLARGT